MDRSPPVERLVEWSRSHPFAIDVTLAGATTMVAAWLLGSGTGTAGVLVGLGLLVPLAWRRRAPVPAAAVVVLAGVAELVVVDRFLVANVAAPAMVYALAAYGPRWAGRAGLGVGLVAGVLAGVRYYYSLGTSYEAVVLVAGAIDVIVVAAWALGRLRRAGMQQMITLAERARLLEVERDQEVRLATTTERARIAREMHDVVAHSLSVVIAQADGGRYAGRDDPAAAASALEAIGSTGRQALTDMRTLLGVLREDGEREYSPQPDVAAVTGLVEDVRVSGLDVDLVVEGEPRTLPAGPQLAAYRIVQESLTNVLKHAGPAGRAWVRLQWRADALEVSVLDDGRGASAAPTPSEGHGLAGMRERAQLHGGRMDAGPRAGGGFGVHAVLPYPARR